MAVKKTSFQTQLEKLHRICLDSVILIYHLEDLEPYSELTQILFARLAAGSAEGIISTISITELLTKPMAQGLDNRVDAFEYFIRSVPKLDLVSPDFAIAKQAARLRASYDMRTPDALLVATALVQKADAFMTNDTSLHKLKAESIKVILLDDYL